MQFWNTIIDTAMMGTEKRQISTDEIPVVLQEAAAFIQQNTAIDKEEKFLQLAALSFNYRQCGLVATKKEIAMPSAPAEEKKYCSEAATQALKDIISEDSISLLKLWLQSCDNNQQLIIPEMVPSILAIGAQQKKLQLLIASCCGKRGEWLGVFNTAWNFSSTHTGEELWQTGTIDQRKEVLKQLRKTDPDKAREWVMGTWAQEDATTKLIFLELLSENAKPQDVPFLESLATEKGKKVKEAAIQLQKLIPGSPVIREYEKLLGQCFILKKEKALLGMMSKTVLQWKVPDSITDELKKAGIDQLSNIKEMTDEEFIIYQLIRSVPPVFIEQQLGLNPEEIIALFNKDTTGKKMLPAMVLAIKQFSDHTWALLFMQHSPVFYIDIIPLLQPKQQELFSNKFFDKFPDSIIKYATDMTTEWSLELTKNIFLYAAKTPYQIHRQFYNQHIDLIPVHIVGELERFTPSEEQFRTMWSTTSEYIIKLITLKIQTIKAFNTSTI